MWNKRHMYGMKTNLLTLVTAGVRVNIFLFLGAERHSRVQLPEWRSVCALPCNKILETLSYVMVYQVSEMY